ncbi:MAG: phosphate ABC transporter permease PstA [Chloroflexi bacterium]|jgi:phosphate transport system permease protein|nr:phosphate ABC transporter permease PstA [Chloroflexota bacterium]
MTAPAGAVPEPFTGEANLSARRRTGAIWRTIFQLSTIIGILALGALIFTIIDKSFGYVLFVYEVDPAELAVGGTPLEQLSREQLIQVFQQNVSAGVFRNQQRIQPLAERSREDFLRLINEYVLEPDIVQTWSLYDSLFNRDQVLFRAQQVEGGQLVFTSWIDPQFLTSPQSRDPLFAGARTAILGSLWIIVVTIVVAFPTGIGAAIYLEEYAGDNWFNRFIQTNINNLAGVPSIIYGMLGLAIFVRTLGSLTSGAAFGFTEPASGNGRTILSAGLTLALLVLPLLIINAQEAIRAVPNSLREASYGLGATKWETVWHHVLPSALPGMLTGAILSISRAIGETAPLVVIGAATYITSDPGSIFSRFTTLPIQIYQWTSRPQAEFRNLAAAAILVLMVLLLTLNTSAILLRNRFSRR